MILDSPARRRRSLGRLLWPVLVVGLVVVALVVSASGEETRSELEYLEEMGAQVWQLSRDGDILRDVISRLPGIERSELITATEGIRDHLDEGLAFVEAEPPNQDLTSVRAMYRLALQRWDAGVRTLVTSLLTAADEPEAVGMVDIVALALAELQAGDALYRELVAELKRADTPDVIAPLPAVQMVPAEGDVMSLANAYTFLARQPGNRLALRPDLKVSQIVSAPRWELNPSNQAVIPVTETVRFSVVVSNMGNVANEPEELLLTLIGGPEPVGEQVPIDPLQPGEQVTMEFAPFEVVPGGIYEVIATLVISGADASPEDNEVTVQFLVNEE